MKNKKPKLAVFKLSSCDGCQLSLLDAEDELLDVLGKIEIAYFPEASRRMMPGPYDIGLVEGSITNPDNVEMIREIRKQCKFLITIGACATSGGIQALKNWKDVKEFTKIVYANPQFISTLDRSLPVGSFIHVDYELRGCPINKFQLIEVINALLNNRKPNIPTNSVCSECKLRGNNCVMVTKEIACLGPVTQAGCNALCPSFNRGCFGCYGPMDSTNTTALAKQLKVLGKSNFEIMSIFRSFNAYAEQFRKESEVYEK
jgi:coenzyme F420-reducing hydrogenase gamma subunit